MNVANLIPAFERSPFQPQHVFVKQEGTLMSKHLLQWFFHRARPGSDQSPKAAMTNSKKIYGPLGVVNSVNEFAAILESDILPALLSKVKILTPADNELGYHVFDLEKGSTHLGEFVTLVKGLLDQISEGKYDSEIDFDSLREGSFPFAVQIAVYVYKFDNLDPEELYSEELKAYHNHDRKLDLNITADLFVGKQGFKDKDPDEDKNEYKIVDTVCAFNSQNQS